jgi:molybdate-binding protein
MISLAPSLAASLIHRIDDILLRKALPHLENMLKIKEVSLKTIESIFRKAARLGALKHLDPEERSMLTALIAYLKKYGRIRSEALIKIVKRIYAKIEAHSQRGRAILIGILLKLRQGKEIEDLEELLVEGLQFINRPITYRAL